MLEIVPFISVLMGLKKTEGVIKNEQSIDTSNIGYKTQDEIKVKENQRGNQE